MLIDTEDPNIIGEWLRDQFFDQTKGYGCYSTFDLREGVVRLPDRVDEEEDEIWKVFEKDINNVGKVKMEYFWDGDGFLTFSLEDGTGYFNFDCKKNNGWQEC